MLTDNNASNNEIGICVLLSSNNTLANNTMSENTCNFGIYGLHNLSEYTQNIDTSNTVDGKPIYYWVDQRDKEIPYNAGFVGVVNSTNITVKDLTLTNNVQGVLFAYTENSRIENVTASNNDYGIFLLESSKNALASNTATNNGGSGIYLWGGGSNNNMLQRNTATNNGGSGIYLEEGTNNNMLQSNTATNNGYGIYLRMSGVKYGASYNNTLQSNICENNDYGIVLTGCLNHTVSSNLCEDNRYGILVQDSGGNTLYHNNLINDTV